ncbi:MAG: sodium:solute symporter family protein [Candidatus Aminicenantes bacterium]|nr:sodium:solute symporter family protein [Candidatus Aminicenantes bacterium]
MRPGLLIALASYFAIVLVIGLTARRRMKGFEDFFLASRRLPGTLVALSLTASWFGAASILVSTDDAFRTGLGALWLVGLPAVASILILFALAGPLRRLPALSLPELAGMRYGRVVRSIASGLLIWYMILLAASQMVAMGRFLGVFMKRPYLECLALGTAVVLIYSLAGGLRSVVATDIIQCALLAVGLSGLVVFLAGKAGGSSAVLGAITGGPGLLAGFPQSGLIFLSFTLAWTISPIAHQRIQAARSGTAARGGLAASAAALAVLYVLVVLIGGLARPLFGGRVPEGSLFPAMIADKLGPWLGSLLFAAVLAAVMSTLDTALNAGGLAIARDVFGRKAAERPERGALASRAALILAAAAAFAVATRFQSILKTIGLASEILAEGFFVPGLAMILSVRRRPWAGLLSLGLGGGFAVLSFLSTSGVLPLPIPAWPFSLPYGLGLSLAGFAFGSALDQRARAIGGQTHGLCSPKR